MRIWTDVAGRIVSVNKEAAQLLNLSQQNLQSRPIHHFFDGDRFQLLEALERTVAGFRGMLAAVVRPREKRPCAVLVVLEADEIQSGLVRWTLRPAPFKHTIHDGDATPSAA